MWVHRVHDLAPCFTESPRPETLKGSQVPKVPELSPVAHSGMLWRSKMLPAAGRALHDVSYKRATVVLEFELERSCFSPVGTPGPRRISSPTEHNKQKRQAVAGFLWRSLLRSRANRAIYIYIYVYIYIYMCVCVHACIHTYIHTYIHDIHTYIHTYIHTLFARICMHVGVCVRAL